MSTPIKGGIVITYRDVNSQYGAIEAFTPYKEVNSILHRVTNKSDFKSICDLVYSRTSYRLTSTMHDEHPNAVKKLSHGHAYDMSSNIFRLLPEIFYDVKPENSERYIKIVGRDGIRITKWIKRSYVNDAENLDFYKIFIAQANGSGLFGESLSSPIIAEPGTGHTETFLSIGKFSRLYEAQSLRKYIKTKFLRTMLGVLKVTQNGNKPVWRMIPLQDFTSDSDIDWSVSVAEIDRQLYKKYGFTQAETDFIESHVKEMA